MSLSLPGLLHEKDIRQVVWSLIYTSQKMKKLFLRTALVKNRNYQLCFFSTTPLLSPSLRSNINFHTGTNSHCSKIDNLHTFLCCLGVGGKKRLHFTLYSRAPMCFCNQSECDRGPICSPTFFRSWLVPGVSFWGTPPEGDGGTQNPSQSPWSPAGRKQDDDRKKRNCPRVCESLRFKPLQVQYLHPEEAPEDGRSQTGWFPVDPATWWGQPQELDNTAHAQKTKLLIFHLIFFKQLIV